MSQLLDIAKYGPVAIVTGASSGIGRSFATLLAQAGFDLLLPARRIERLKALATELQSAHGVSVVPLQVDLNSTAAVDSCLLYTSPSPRDRTRSRMPSSA